MNKQYIQMVQSDAQQAYERVDGAAAYEVAQAYLLAEIALQLAALNERLAQKPPPPVQQPEYATRPCGRCDLEVTLDGTHVGTRDGNTYHQACYVAMLADADINTY